MNYSFQQPLTAKEEDEYLKELFSGNKEARDILVERNLRLVAHISKKYALSGINSDDLISIGTIGLIKAINTYNQGHSTKLGTYAAKCIENEILMYLRANKKNRNEVSLNEPLGTDKDGNEINFNEILGTETDTVLDALYLKLQCSELYLALNTCLSKREKEVIILRYGLYNCDILPQREVAKQLGISRSYVSRIEKKALSKLKAQLITEQN